MKGPGSRPKRDCWVHDCFRAAFTSIEVVVAFRGNNPANPIKEEHYVCSYHKGRMAPPLRNKSKGLQL